MGFYWVLGAVFSFCSAFAEVWENFGVRGPTQGCRKVRNRRVLHVLLIHHLVLLVLLLRLLRHGPAN